MVRIGAVLAVVLIAFGLLAAGVVAGSLLLVVASIGVAALAFLMLLAVVLIWRKEIFGTAITGHAGQQPAVAVGADEQVLRQADRAAAQASRAAAKMGRDAERAAARAAKDDEQQAARDAKEAAKAERAEAELAQKAARAAQRATRKNAEPEPGAVPAGSGTGAPDQMAKATVLAGQAGWPEPGVAASGGPDGPAPTQAVPVRGQETGSAADQGDAASAVRMIDMVAARAQAAAKGVTGDADAGSSAEQARKPGVSRRSADRSSADRSGADRQPGRDRPGGDRHAAERSGAGKPGRERIEGRSGSGPADRDQAGGSRQDRDRDSGLTELDRPSDGHGPSQRWRDRLAAANADRTGGDFDGDPLASDRPRPDDRSAMSRLERDSARPERADRDQPGAQTQASSDEGRGGGSSEASKITGPRRTLARGPLERAGGPTAAGATAGTGPRASEPPAGQGDLGRTPKFVPSAQLGGRPPGREPGLPQPPSGRRPGSDQPSRPEASAEPAAKAAEPRAAEPRMAEPKPAEAMAQGPKAPEPKAPEPKAPEPKAPEPKAPEPKAPEPKAQGPKAPDLKAPDLKAPEPKAPEPKAVEPAVKPGDPVTKAAESAGPATAANGDAAMVRVVPGITRYHRSDCLLIRFLGDDDLETMSRDDAKADGCVPCKACQPDQASADLPVG